MPDLQEFTLPSTDGIHSLHICCWQPTGTVRGVVQLSHGISEYVARYDHYARFLAENGFVVLGNDHLGFGGTVTTPEELGYPGKPGAWLHMVDDLYTVCQYGKRTYPDLPYVLLGHSMGSFLARSFLIRYPQEVDGCILSGTGQEASAVVRSGSLLVKLLRRLKGGTSHLPLIQTLCFGTYNNKVPNPRTSNDWLSRDAAQVDAYNADPLCGMTTSTAMADELLFGLQYIWKGSNLKQMNRSTPLYLYAGDQDPVGQYGKGVQRVAERFRSLGCQSVTVRLYPDGRHEMHNEYNRSEVYADTLAWLTTLIEGGFA